MITLYKEMHFAFYDISALEVIPTDRNTAVQWETTI